MARISAETRASNEDAIRAVMDRILKGDLRPEAEDLNTSAAEAGVTSTAL